MHKARVFAAAAFALLLVAACGSSGNYGDILNGGSRTYDIHGTVDSCGYTVTLRAYDRTIVNSNTAITFSGAKAVGFAVF